MKKVIPFIVLTIFSSVLFAQNITPPAMSVTGNPVVKIEMKHLRKTIRAERQDKRQRRAYIKAGNEIGAQQMTLAINTKKTDIKNSVERLKADGVKHPELRAQHQLRRRQKFQH